MNQANISVKERKKDIVYDVLIWLIISVLNILIYNYSPIFDLNENQVLYLFSSASQVIAAIYGLIITGYIFLRNELDRKAEKDDTFEEIIMLLKGEYFFAIIGITITTFISILLCFLVIASETLKILIPIDYLINISIAAILANLISIMRFVIKILNPKSLELASNRLHDITAGEQPKDKGSLEEFLINYNQIEYILDKYGSVYLYPKENLEFELPNRKRIAKTKLTYILYQEEKINKSLQNDLIELITFRNSLIHGTKLFVSAKDVEKSGEILNELKKSLGLL